MFRSVARLIPSFGARLASTVAVAPRSMISYQPVNSGLKQTIQFVQPAQPQNLGIMQQILEKIEPVSESASNELIMTSVLRKRRLKMKKHKLRKRRKAQRALRIKIGK